MSLSRTESSASEISSKRKKASSFMARTRGPSCHSKSLDVAVSSYDLEKEGLKLKRRCPQDSTCVCWSGHSAESKDLRTRHRSCTTDTCEDPMQTSENLKVGYTANLESKALCEQNPTADSCTEPTSFLNRHIILCYWTNLVLWRLSHWPQTPQEVRCLHV